MKLFSPFWTIPLEKQRAMEISAVRMYILVQTSDILSGGLVDVSHGSG